MQEIPTWGYGIDERRIQVWSREAEKMVKKTEPKSELKKRYGILIENISEGVCILDKNRVPIYVNRKFCEITGFPKDEILDKYPLQFIKGKTIKRFKSELEKKRKGQDRKSVV